MQARIYRPARNAMQSGPSGRSKQWLLEYEPERAQRPDPLMGWTGGAEPSAQVRLSFASQEEAVAYATKHGLTFQIAAEPKKPFRPKNYADNFKSDKLEFGRF